MPFSIAPAFVQIEYSSPKSLHTMRIPTRGWSPPGGGFTNGSYLRWSDDVEIDADTMIGDLIAVLDDNLPDTHSFISYTIFTQNDVDEDPQPRLSQVVNAPGTIATPDWWEAVQATWNFRDTDFTAMKLTLMDADSENLFGKLVNVAGVARWNNVALQISDEDNAWSSRNGFRPATILSVTRTLNEKLRRAYGHTG